MTVFIVTTGSYSDYRIQGVFSDRSTAEGYIETTPDLDEPEIEEYEVDVLVKPL